MNQRKCATGKIFAAFSNILFTPITHMQTAVDTPMLALLLKAYNKEVKDFYFFPEIVLIGRQRIEQQELTKMLSEGYLVKTAADSFGRCYRLSAKAEQVLLMHRKKRSIPRTKKNAAASNQPLLYFD